MTHIPPINPRVDNPAAVVIGGANIDHKCQTLDRPVPGTSNPGRMLTSLGGVGRNVAENLARLGTSTALITALGTDDLGARIHRETDAAGVDVRHVILSSHPTGSYTAVLDESGEMVIAVSAMDAMNDITVENVDARRALIANARILLLDCNVPEDAMGHAAEIAHRNGVPVLVEPVSVAKVQRITPILTAGFSLHTITPNLDEVHRLTGATGSSRADLCAAASRLHAAGVQNVWIRLGINGSFLSVARDGETQVEMIAAGPATLVDATGAGDAMLAGYMLGVLRGLDPFAAARYGRAAAAITVESAETVNPSLSLAMLLERAGGSAESHHG
jgi:pseudouridine kinase